MTFFVVTTTISCPKCQRTLDFAKEITPIELGIINDTHHDYRGDFCSGDYAVKSVRKHTVKPERMCSRPGCTNTARRGHMSGRLCGYHRRFARQLNGHLYNQMHRPATAY